jgi:hypothetical protein
LGENFTNQVSWFLTNPYTGFTPPPMDSYF